VHTETENELHVILDFDSFTTTTNEMKEKKAKKWRQNVLLAKKISCPFTTANDNDDDL